MKAKSILIILLFLSTLEIFAESTELWRIPTYYADVRMAEVSNSGDFFAGFHQRLPTLQIFNLRSGEIIQTKAIDFEVLDIKFSRIEDKLELFSYQNDEFVLNTIDLETGSLSTEKIFSDLKPEKIRFKDNNIFALFPDGSLKVWDKETRDELDFPTIRKYNVSNFNIADSIALVHSNDTIFVFNYKTGYEYVSFRYIYQGNLDYAVNLDLNRVYIGNIYNNTTVERFDFSTGDYIDGWTVNPGKAWFFNNEIVIAQQVNNIYFYDMFSGELIDEIEIGSKYYVVNDDLNILLSVGERKIEYWDLESKTKEYEWLEGNIQDFLFSKDNKQIILLNTQDDDTRFCHVNTGNLEFVRYYSAFKGNYLRNYNEYNSLLMDSLTTDSVQLVNWNTEEINESFVLPDVYFGCIIPQTKEYLFFISDWDSIHVHDYKSKEKLFSLKLDIGSTHWSYSGRYLIGKEGFDSHLIIYDCKNRRIIFEDNENLIYNYHFGDKEGVLYYQILDDGIYKMHLESLESEKIFNYKGKGTAFKTLDNNFCFTDKDFFVEGINKGDINVRKIETEEIILTVDDYPVDVYSIVLSDDHTKLAVSYWDGAFIMYDLGDALSVNETDHSISISAYPNPFSVSTTINYELEMAGYVTVKVFDVLGNGVIELVNEFQSSGVQSCMFIGENLPSSVYYYRIQIGDYTQTGKLVLLR